MGTVGTQDVDCDFIDFTFVRVSSDELERVIRKTVTEFKVRYCKHKPIQIQRSTQHAHSFHIRIRFIGQVCLHTHTEFGSASDTEGGKLLSECVTTGCGVMGLGLCVTHHQVSIT